MIGFDLDGVFVGDLTFNTNDELNSCLKVRTQNIQPIFRPTFPYVIITGRPKIDEDDTKAWFAKNFFRQPDRIFHDNEDMKNARKYKERILTENTNITIFVESDLDQVKYLSKLPLACKVIHFESFLQDMFSKMK